MAYRLGEFSRALNQTAAPTTTDDDSAGFEVGSRWYDTTADQEYVCMDATTSSSVWKGTTATGGGGGDFVGPASSVADNVVSFDGVTGKLGKDSGISAADITGSVTVHSDVSNAGSGSIITSGERIVLGNQSGTNTGFIEKMRVIWIQLLE